MAKARRVIEGWDYGSQSVRDSASDVVYAIQRDGAARLLDYKPDAVNPVRRRITITVEDAKPKAGKAKR